MNSRLPFQLTLSDSSPVHQSSRSSYSRRDKRDKRARKESSDHSRYSLQAVQISPTQVELVVARKTPTVFYAILPPFLLNAPGFYLGQSVQPQVLINGQYYYLKLSSTQPSTQSVNQCLSVYEISTTKSDLNLSFRLVNLDLVWNCPIPFDTSSTTTSSTVPGNDLTKCLVQSFQSCPPESKNGAIFSNFTLANRSTDCFNEIIFKTNIECGINHLVYSPSACDLSKDALTCGTEVCPEDFSVSPQSSSQKPGACVSNQGETGRISFGLRYLNASGQPMVITYRDELVNGQTKVVFEYVDPSQLGLDSNDPQHPRERWFFADTPTREFEVGALYPIYVTFGSGLKFYLTPPRRGAFVRNSQGITEFPYDTVRDSTGSILSFQPKTVGRFNQFVFTKEDFHQLRIPDSNPKIALWKGIPYQDQPAVVPGETSPVQMNSVRGPIGGSVQTAPTKSTRGTRVKGATDFTGSRRKSGTTHVPRDRDLISTDIIPGQAKRGFNNLSIPATSTGLNQPSSSFYSSWAFFVGVILVILLVFYLGFVLYQSHRLDPEGDSELEYSPTKVIAPTNLTSYWVPLPPNYVPPPVITPLYPLPNTSVRPVPPVRPALPVKPIPPIRVTSEPLIQPRY